MASDNIVNTTTDGFDADVIEHSNTTPVLVDFWAPWCRPCRMLAPVLDEIADTHTENLRVVKVDVEQHEEVMGRFSLVSIPTLLLFKNGEVVEQVTGVKPKAKLLDLINPHLA